MKKTMLGMFSLLAAGSTAADQYHIEASAEYNSGEFQETIDYDSYAVSLTGYWNFVGEDTGVSLDEGTYSEAGFLSQASSLTVIHAEADIGTDDISSVDARLVFGEGSILEFSGSDNPDSYSIAFGSYWGENSATVVRLSKIDTDPLNGVDSDPLKVEVDTHTYVDLGDTALSYDVVIGWATADTLKNGSSETDFSPVLGGGFTYYPIKNLGLGAALNWNELEGVDVFTYSAGAEYFVIPRLSISVSYLFQDAGDSIGEHNEAFSISLTGRI